MGQTCLPSLLIADSDPASQFRMATRLVDANYQVSTARLDSTATALACLEPLDLLIIDAGFSLSGGAEFYRRLSRRSGLRKLPAIFLSSSQRADVYRKRLPFGTHYFLKKPVHLDVALGLIDQILGIVRSSKLKPRQTSSRLNKASGKKAIPITPALPTMPHFLSHGSRVILP
ncbi:MAG: response regulator [Planctomycetota bacterium]